MPNRLFGRIRELRGLFVLFQHLVPLLIDFFEQTAVTLGHVLERFGRIRFEQSGHKRIDRDIALAEAGNVNFFGLFCEVCPFDFRVRKPGSEDRIMLLLLLIKKAAPSPECPWIKLPLARE